MDTAVHDRLIARFEPELQGLGYELVEVEFAPGPGGGTLRFYIDKPRETDQGIDAEDCATVSHALLDSIERTIRSRVITPSRCLRPGWIGCCARRSTSPGTWTTA